MASDRVFYPVRDVTLKGLFSGSEAELYGLLSNARAVLRGYSDIWAFREYLMIQSGFAVAAELIMSSAIKELEVKGGITLDVSDVELVCGKSVSGLTADMVLSVIISTAARKTVELQEQIGMCGNVQESVRKWLSGISSAIAIDGVISDASMQSDMAGLISCIGAICGLETVSKKTEAKCEALLAGMSEELKLYAEKNVVLTHGVAALSGSLKAVIRRYRTFLDIQGMRFQDVSAWGMNTFYYLEV